MMLIGTQITSGRHMSAWVADTWNILQMVCLSKSAIESRKVDTASGQVMTSKRVATHRFLPGAGWKTSDILTYVWRGGEGGGEEGTNMRGVMDPDALHLTSLR